MMQFLSGYIIFALTFLVIYVALTTVLHIQATLTGITNFGIVGFWGLGMYSFALFQLKLDLPYIPALLLAIALTGLVALLLGRVILDLDSQEVLVGTLAFANIVEYLATTEKWLTNGVLGLGTIFFPFDFGKLTLFVYFLILVIITVLLIMYVAKLRKSPYGRMLQSISDNEPLAKSLGKPTFRNKLVLFAFTCAVTGLLGAMTAPVYNYIFPRMIGSGVTFTAWIALMIGGRKKLMGGVVGTLMTVGIFEIIVETVVPIPADFAEVVPNIRFFAYGLMLILVFMFKPNGVLGGGKKGAKA